MIKRGRQRQVTFALGRPVYFVLKRNEHSSFTFTRKRRADHDHLILISKKNCIELFQAVSCAVPEAGDISRELKSSLLKQIYQFREKRLSAVEGDGRKFNHYAFGLGKCIWAAGQHLFFRTLDVKLQKTF